MGGVALCYHHNNMIFLDPERSYDFPKAYLDKVKRVHQEGGFGSEG